MRRNSRSRRTSTTCARPSPTSEIAYPVAIDNDYAIWRAFKNQYWPAHYFIDAKGQIRHHHFGEGDYDESERVIQQLLAEAGTTDGTDRSGVGERRRRRGGART